jgi:polyhydroxybutyrate depolymerase
MNHTARAIGPGIQHYARAHVSRMGPRGARRGCTLAVALSCLVSCGADKASSANAAGTTTEPASVATSGPHATNSNTTTASSGEAISPNTGSAAIPAISGTSTLSPPNTSTDSLTENSEPAVTTSDSTLIGGATSAGEDASEGEVIGTGPTGTAGPGASSTSAGCGKSPSLTSGNATIDVDGTARQYILDLPDNYDPSKPYKLVFGLHWRGGQASDVATGGTVGLGNYYGLEDLADGSSVFVAPNGLDNGWANTGGRDIKFLKAILAKFQDDLCIDLDRVFSVGFSFGGMMSFAIACEMGDVFRAIAPLSGALYSGCGNGTAPIAMWGAHGTADDVVPIGDGRAGLQEVLDRNHCGTETTPTSPDTCFTYSGCDAGYPVTWCEFDGGHGPQRWQTQPIWEFFSQF